MIPLTIDVIIIEPIKRSVYFTASPTEFLTANESMIYLGKRTARMPLKTLGIIFISLRIKYIFSFFNVNFNE